MNFILSIFGSATSPGGLRLRDRTGHPLTAAGALAARGEFAAAAQVCAPPRGHRRRDAWRHAAHAHLLLLANNPAAAEHAFARAAAILLRHGSPAQNSGDYAMDALDDFPDAAQLRGTTLQRLGLAERNLRAGHFPRAIALLQRALSLVEVLLAAQAGRIVSNARRTQRSAPALAEPLISPARLSDALLRSLARAHLAENLAASLRPRTARSDLALWATGAERVEQLLQTQYALLLAAGRQHPSTIELHHRTGLIARSLGDLEAAQCAFSRVLSLHPHHLGAATRFAATGLELEQLEQVMPVLAVALAVPADLLARYRALARAAEQPERFDQTVENLIAQAGPASDPASIRANLALALAELGLLDPAHAHWRDPLRAATPNAA